MWRINNNWVSVSELSTVMIVLTFKWFCKQQPVISIVGIFIRIKMGKLVKNVNILCGKTICLSSWNVFSYLRNGFLRLDYFTLVLELILICMELFTSLIVQKYLKENYQQRHWTIWQRKTIHLVHIFDFELQRALQRFCLFCASAMLCMTPG